MLTTAVLPFIVVAAALALLVVRSDTRHLHQSVRHPGLPPMSARHAQRRARKRTDEPASSGRRETVERQGARLRSPAQLGVVQTQARQLQRWTQTLAMAGGAWARARATARPGLVLLVAVAGYALVLAGVASFVTGRTAAPPAPVEQATAASSADVAPPPPTADPAQTPAPTALATDNGSPFSGAMLIAAWTGRSLRVEASTETLACEGTSPKAYRATGSSGQGQLAVVFVYPSATAMSADWAVERGSPLTFRRGSCTPPGSVTYWNLNMVVVFPQTTDFGTRQQMSDAFLRLGS